MRSLFGKATKLLLPSEPTTKVAPPIPTKPFPVYYAALMSLYDGDTITFEIDKWFGNSSKVKVRLKGIDAPELSTPEGKVSKGFVNNWLGRVIFDAREQPFVIWLTGHDKYGGRMNGYVYDAATGECLNQTLFDNGMAVQYPKKKVV